MNAQVREEAATWLVEFRTGAPDTASRERFAAWLRASPEHVRAYLALASVWEDAAGLRERDLDALIDLARGEEGNVVALEARVPSAPEDASDESATVPSAAAADSRRPRRRFVWAAAAALAAALGLASLLYLNRDPTYSTQLGEQRTLELADGSTVELNARSRIRVHFALHERRVTLLEGQALFSVMHNAARPFIVVSGETRVEDVGTQFAVAREASSTVVTVIEGRVAVVHEGLGSPGGGSAAVAPAVLVSAGEQVSVAAGVVARPHRANVAAATAWTQQQLVFESTPLSEAADAFNRFNARQLHVAGPALADFHVSGTFPARDPTSLARFVLFLRAQPGIEVQESDDEIRVSPK